MKRIFKFKRNGHTHVYAFDLDETYKMKEFRSFVTLKESKHNFTESALKKKFGDDLYVHLDLAYNFLKEVENEYN